MQYDFSITCLKCQNCTAKIHCDECARELSGRLLHAGVHAAEIDIPKRSARIRADMDGDDLLNLMEEIGVFAD